MGLIPGSGWSPGGGHGNPLLCSCLENPVDRKAWWATVHRVVKLQTRLSNLPCKTHTNQEQIESVSLSEVFRSLKIQAPALIFNSTSIY